MTIQTNANPPTSPSLPQLKAPAARSDERRRSPIRNFARRYAEMLVAMFLGMFVLGFALAALLELAGVGVSSWDTEAPALLLLAMAFTMTVPMVAWMRHRGHRRRLSWEMSAAMFVPSVLAIGLLSGDAVGDVHAAMGVQHIGMFPAMLVSMLLRRDEYSRH